jgi:hypothetical protein
MTQASPSTRWSSIYFLAASILATSMLAGCPARSSDWADKSVLSSANSVWRQALEEGHVEATDKSGNDNYKDGECNVEVLESSVTAEPKAESEIGQFVAQAVIDRVCSKTEERCWVSARANEATGGLIWKMEKFRCETTGPLNSAPLNAAEPVEKGDNSAFSEQKKEIEMRRKEFDEVVRRSLPPKQGENPFEAPELPRISERCREYAARKQKEHSSGRPNPYAPAGG